MSESFTGKSQKMTELCHQQGGFLDEFLEALVFKTISRTRKKEAKAQVMHGKQYAVMDLWHIWT